MSIWTESVANLCPICEFLVEDKNTKKEAAQFLSASFLFTFDYGICS